MASKSAKQLALQRSRQAAIAAGTLPAWYEARRAEQAQERAQVCAQSEAAEPAPYTPSPAFQRAYSGQPITPEGASWDDRGYMVWRLPVHELPQAPRRAYTPRLTPNF